MGAIVKSYPEQSAITVTAKLYGASDQKLIPTGLQYRIDCETNRQLIVDWTAITPVSVAQVPVTASQNAILNRRNASERKVMTIQSNPGLATQVSAVVRWDITNEQGVH